jgi:hypothetical protein
LDEETEVVLVEITRSFVVVGQLLANFTCGSCLKDSVGGVGGWEILHSVPRRWDIQQGV